MSLTTKTPEPVVPAYNLPRGHAVERGKVAEAAQTTAQAEAPHAAQPVGRGAADYPAQGEKSECASGEARGRRGLGALTESARVKQMNRDQIKLDHCYSMMPIYGCGTIARVTKLFRITAMAAYDEMGNETLELNPVVVRFVWRHAAYPTGWSNRRQQLLLDDFVLAVEKEITST